MSKERSGNTNDSYNTDLHSKNIIKTQTSTNSRHIGTKMLGMWGKVRILPHWGLGACLLGIPTLKPTTLRVLASMEKARRNLRKAVESVEKKERKGRRGELKR